MKVSLIQLAIKASESREELEERVFGLMDQCRGSDIIVLPELWNVGILHYRRIWDFAEEIDGPLMRRVSAKAKELGAYVNCGSFVHKVGDRIYNTSVFFDRKGTDIAEYSKMHLFSCFGREADTFAHGKKPVVVDTEFGKVGIAICYDLRFPELFRAMALQMGAEMFIVPAAWPSPRGDVFLMLARARAIENSAFVLTCNIFGRYGLLDMPGNSCIIDPWGNMLTAILPENCIISGDISMDTVHQTRREFPVFRDVRPISVNS